MTMEAKIGDKVIAKSGPWMRGNREELVVDDWEYRLLLLVGGTLLLVALLVLGGRLLPLGLVLQLVPLEA